MTNKIVQVNKLVKGLAGATVVSLGVVAFALADQSASTSPAAVSAPQSTPAATPTPSQAPSVTVNGKPVPLGANGIASIESSSTRTEVQVSGGEAHITTNKPSQETTTTVTGNGNLNVHVDSNTSGGTNWSTTQVHGTSHSFDGGSGFSHTSTISTGSTQVNP